MSLAEASESLNGLIGELLNRLTECIIKTFPNQFIFFTQNNSKSYTHPLSNTCLFSLDVNMPVS
jgi:hypothetical protein